jgi:UDP-glucose 4-epimerase
LRALITGGAGFIGSHLASALIKSGAEVTVFDDFSSGFKKNLVALLGHKGFTLTFGNVCDYSQINNALQDIDVVFHEAAYLDFEGSIKDPQFVNWINVNGTLNVLQACVDSGVKRLVFASSAAVYGTTDLPNKNEGMNTEPTNPYGISKLAGECYVKAYYRLYGLETVALRYFNVYGPRQRFDLLGGYGGVITIFLNRIMRNLPPIIHGDGQQTRDFISVEDVIQANMLAMSTKKGIGEAFNIGSGTSTSVNQVAQHIKKLLGKDHIQNEYKPARTADIKYWCADISKAKSILGFNPQISFEQGISSLVDWYKQNVPQSALAEN